MRFICSLAHLLKFQERGARSSANFVQLKSNGHATYLKAGRSLERKLPSLKSGRERGWWRFRWVSAGLMMELVGSSLIVARSSPNSFPRETALFFGAARVTSPRPQEQRVGVTDCRPEIMCSEVTAWWTLECLRYFKCSSKKKERE
jgi:hypothetical protein